MDLFLPESGLVIWMLIAFTIVFVVLAKFGWPVILKSLKNREERIASSLKKADEAMAALSGLEQKGKDIVAQAEAEQVKLLGETKVLKNKMIEEAKAEAAAEAEKMLAGAREQIAHEKEAAIAQLQAEVAKLSVQIAEKVLRRELSDEKSQRAYIESLLNQQEQHHE